jgi:hypothetical protein
VLRTNMLDSKDLRVHEDTLSTGFGIDECLRVKLGTITCVDALKFIQKSCIGRVFQGSLRQAAQEASAGTGRFRSGFVEKLLKIKYRQYRMNAFQG